MEQYIEKIDKNFKLEREISKDGMAFYNVNKPPFKIYGVLMDDGEFCRMPKSIAKTVNEGVERFNLSTAGGRVKFKTNSKRIAIIVKCTNVCKMPHFSFSGSIGLDVYVRKKGKNCFCGSFIPNIDVKDGFESSVCFENDGINEVTINMPLYSGVSGFLIGVEENAIIRETDGYSVKKPIVYYGSSITQGACASRPGNTYQALISRRFDCDYINLGFSGSAKGEDEIINYIKNIDMSVFVYDYDHNAPTLGHLENTHKKGFKVIRKCNPKLPIIIMSRPKYYLFGDEKKCLNIIKNTYLNAIKNGDNNVYFLCGKDLMKIAKDNGTVDSGHPTDFGFYSMSEALSKIIKNII